MEKATLGYSGSNCGREAVMICQRILPLPFLILTVINQRCFDIRVYAVDTDKIDSQLLRLHLTGDENEFL